MQITNDVSQAASAAGTTPPASESVMASFGQRRVPSSHPAVHGGGSLLMQSLSGVRAA